MIKVRFVNGLSEARRNAGEGPWAGSPRKNIRHAELVLAETAGSQCLEKWDRARLWTEIGKAHRPAAVYMARLPAGGDADYIELGYRMARFFVDQCGLGVVDFTVHGAAENGVPYPHLRFVVAASRVTSDAVEYRGRIDLRHAMNVARKHWEKLRSGFVIEHNLATSMPVR